MSWTDKDIDRLYQDRVNDLRFDFKPKYWKEFSAGLPLVPEMSVNEAPEGDIDRLFQASASEVSIDYKPEYWDEMAAMLPRRKNRDFLWFATAAVALGLITAASFVQPPTAITHTVMAENAAANETGVQTETEAVLDASLSTEDVEQPTAESITPSDEELMHSVETSNFGLVDRGGMGNDASDLNDFPVIVDIVDPAVDDAEERLSLYEELVELSIANNDEQLVDPRIAEADLEVELDEEINQRAEVTSVDHLPTNEVATIETVNRLSVPKIIPAPTIDLPVQSRFYVELNGGLSQSLITPSDRIGSSAGIGIGAQFTKGRLIFITGVNGVCTFNEDLVLNRQAKVYGFGSDVYNYTLNYDQLYTIEANLSAGYRFGRHQVTAGVRPSYVVGTKVGFSLIEDDVKGDRKVVYGHTDGIQRFGIKPMIGYSFDLPSNFTIGLNIGAQVMSSVNEEYIDGVNRKLPIDGQFYIRKTLNWRRR